MKFGLVAAYLTGEMLFIIVKLRVCSRCLNGVQVLDWYLLIIMNGKASYLYVIARALLHYSGKTQ